jgi:hypothetical protein
MKTGSYVVALIISALCGVLAVALIFAAGVNQRLQARLQNQQQALNNGILGQQGQQITGNVIQDIAGAAARNPGLRDLLEKHGYRLQADAAAAPATNVTQSAQAGGPTSMSTQSESVVIDKP